MRQLVADLALSESKQCEGCYKRDGVERDRFTVPGSRYWDYEAFEVVVYRCRWCQGHWQRWCHRMKAIGSKRDTGAGGEG